MTENIDRMLQRGEKLELLTDKTETLMSEVGGDLFSGELHVEVSSQRPLCIDVNPLPPLVHLAGRPVPAHGQGGEADVLVAEHEDEAHCRGRGAAARRRHLPHHLLRKVQVLPVTSASDSLGFGL